MAQTAPPLAASISQRRPVRRPAVPFRNFIKPRCMVVYVLLLPLLAGCGILYRPFLAPVQHSLEREEDLDTLLTEMPNLLAILETALATAPRDRHLLLAATRAYATYALLLTNTGRESTTAAAYAAKAKTYGQRLLATEPPLTGYATAPMAQLPSLLAQVRDPGVLFWAANAWAIWIQGQNGAAAAMADMPRVAALMRRVLALDEGYYHGGAHLFFGSYLSTVPVMLGGNPELARSHFERALALSHRKFLLTQVLYADTYARQTLDRQLFENLLAEVIAATPQRDTSMAANQLAKRMAARYLQQIDTYFE